MFKGEKNMSINKDDIIEIICNMRDVIEKEKLMLTELDAAIGDGDHGLNLSRGFNAAVEKLESTAAENAAAVVKSTAMALISKVGGASGPLYGTAFLKAASVIDGKEEIDIKDFSLMMKAALEGIKSRGKAEKGDKTMIDAIDPAIEAVDRAVEAGEKPVDVLKSASEAALSGVEYTKTISARKGRAAYLGDRSIGHQDPGATSAYFIINSIYQYISKKES